MSRLPAHTTDPAQTVDLHEVFTRAVTSTWVITSGTRWQPAGFTTTSVVSVSAEPPVVSFNLGRESSFRGAILSSSRVAIHLLRDDQEHLARRFAGERRERFRPDGQWYWHADGLPTLHGHVARLQATVTDLHEAGDSLVATATVTEQELGDGDVLAYHHGEYRSLDEQIDLAISEAFAQSA